MRWQPKIGVVGDEDLEGVEKHVPGEALGLVTVGVVIDSVRNRKQHVGIMGDNVQVGRPGGEPKRRQVRVRTSLGGKALDLAEQSYKGIRR